MITQTQNPVRCGVKLETHQKKEKEKAPQIQKLYNTGKHTFLIRDRGSQRLPSLSLGHWN